MISTDSSRGAIPRLPRWRQRFRGLARGVLWRVLPAYMRARVRRADMEARLVRAEDAIERVGERHGEQIERLEELARELVLSAEALRRSVVDVDAAMKTEAQSAQRGIEGINAELNALPYMADSPFEVLPSPVGEVLGFRSCAAVRDGRGGYAEFEDLFRGPFDRVAESQRPYLVLVRDHEPVVDLGCGRGEFLRLLADEGIAAQGVDSDEQMVERCRALGAEATLADANEYLERLEDASVGVVFSAQLIEHLPYAELTRLFELSRRKLVPGGLLIAETVNPHRVASLKTFWVDPTHQHPIFPEVALALAAAAGYESAYVFAPAFDAFERARFESPAYALVASASGSEAAG